MWNMPHRSPFRQEFTCQDDNVFDSPTHGAGQWTSCGTGFICPKLPPAPPNQPSNIPWDGDIVMEQDPFLYLGDKCLGDNLPYNNYEYARTCPQVGVRTHRYEQRSNNWTITYVDFNVKPTAPNDTIWLNVSFSKYIHPTHGKFTFLVYLVLVTQDA